MAFRFVIFLFLPPLELYPISVYRFHPKVWVLTRKSFIKFALAILYLCKDCWIAVIEIYRNEETIKFATIVKQPIDCFGSAHIHAQEKDYSSGRAASNKHQLDFGVSIEYYLYRENCFYFSVAKTLTLIDNLNVKNQFI